MKYPYIFLRNAQDAVDMDNVMMRLYRDFPALVRQRDLLFSHTSYPYVRAHGGRQFYFTGYGIMPEGDLYRVNSPQHFESFMRRMIAKASAPF